MAFGLTFQQVQKYEKGMNRMGSSRLQQAADILGVAVPFFFEGGPGGSRKMHGNAPSMDPGRAPLLVFPLNGTWTRSSPCESLNSSPERCGVVPSPAEAKLYYPGHRSNGETTHDRDREPGRGI